VNDISDASVMTALSGAIASLTMVGAGAETTGDEGFSLAFGPAALSLQPSADTIANADPTPQSGNRMTRRLTELGE
jgi:hypothetical protein